MSVRGDMYMCMWLVDGWVGTCDGLLLSKQRGGRAGKEEEDDGEGRTHILSLLTHTSLPSPRRPSIPPHLKELVDLDGVGAVEVEQLQEAVHVLDPLLGGQQGVDGLAPVFLLILFWG